MSAIWSVGERRRRVEAWFEDGRPIDPLVLRAMIRVPRHAFVPEELQEVAYDDRPLPIGLGQTISQPSLVARMTDLLDVRPDSRVLEIGTGSGYQAAVLAHLTPHVFTIEVLPELAERAGVLLRSLGYESIRFRTGDGAIGWPEEAPFDRVLLTCAAEGLPPALWEQLKPGGRALFPMGDPGDTQILTLADKLADGHARIRRLMPVRFVPLTSG